MRRADDDIAFKKRQLKEIEAEVNQKKQRINQQKEVEGLQAQFEEKLAELKELREKQQDVLNDLFKKLETVASLTQEEAERSLVSHVEMVAKKRARGY